MRVRKQGNGPRRVVSLAVLASAAVVAAGFWNANAEIPGALAGRSCLAIAYTGNALGVLEPCGCSPDGGMIGGLARRSSLIQGLRTRYPGVLLLDTGNAAASAGQADLILGSMRDMGYDVLGLGLSDLLTRDAILPAIDRAALKCVNALPDLNRLPSSISREAVLVRSGRLIGVLGVSPTPVDMPAGATWKRLEPALRSLRADADVVVLLSQLGSAQDCALAAQQTERLWIDLIIVNG